MNIFEKCSMQDTTEFDPIFGESNCRNS